MQGAFVDEHNQQGADIPQAEQHLQAQPPADEAPRVITPASAGADAPTHAVSGGDENATGEPPVTDVEPAALAPQATYAEPASPDAATAAALQARGELAPGSHIGNYRILGQLTGDIAQILEGVVYEAIWKGAEGGAGAPGDEWDAPAAPRTELRYAVVERTGDTSTDLAHLVAMGLQHPRLLAPRALVSTDAHTWLVIETPPIGKSAQDTAQPGVQTARLVSRGAHLAPTEALRACAGLAHALSYLHRNAVAHLHVSPDTILLGDGRAYLAGIERATVVGWDGGETAPLFARDANFLARTLGAMLPPPSAAGQESESASETLAARAAHEIVTQGEAGRFTSVDEVAAACGTVVQTQNQALGDEMAAPSRLRILVGTASDVGRVRSENQDAFGVSSFQVQDDCGSPAPLAVFLVADGMGGEAHGEIASRIAARTVLVEMARHFTLPTLIWPVLSLLGESDVGESGAQASDESAGENTGERTTENNTSATSGTTEGGLPAAAGASLAQALAVAGAHAALAHIGDSRAYLLRDGRFLQLTEDHSLLARLEAIDHPLLSDPSFIMPRSVLYRSLGQEEDAAPDMFEFTLAARDRLLLCSDGLWDELSDATLEVELAAATEPLACAERLVALANGAGGNDNSTVVILFVADPMETDGSSAASGAATATNGADGVVGVGDTTW